MSFFPGNKIPMRSHICSSHALESARLPLADGWVNGMGYIYKIAFCSVVKNKMILVTGKWAKLEIVTVSKTSQTHNATYCHSSVKSRFLFFEL